MRLGTVLKNLWIAAVVSDGGGKTLDSTAEALQAGFRETAMIVKPVEVSR